MIFNVEAQGDQVLRMVFTDGVFPAVSVVNDVFQRGGSRFSVGNTKTV